MENKILKAYSAYLLEKNERPLSVYQFAAASGISEGEFYDHFGSFEAIENRIMLDLCKPAMQEAQADPAYIIGKSRDKFKIFLRTWMHALKQHRSLVLILDKLSGTRLGITPSYMKEMKEEFGSFSDALVSQAIESREIENRKLISDNFADGLWLQLLFIYRFWLKDDSRGFEKTRETIDKSVDLSFDMMAKTTMDTAFDLGKFLFKNFKL